MHRKTNTLNKLKVALIGCGFIGLSGTSDNKTKKYFNFITHFQTINFHSKFIPYIAVDKDKAKLKKAQKLGFQHIYTSIDEINIKSEIDVLVVALPPSERFDIIKNFNMVRAIICEKPLALSFQEILKIENHCKKNKINLYVNYWRRYDKKIIKLKKSLLKKRIGNFQTGFATYGGSFFSNGVHLLDVIDFLLGPIKSIVKTNFDLGNDQGYLITLKNKKNIFISFIKFDFYREIYIDFWGSEGRVIVAHEGLDLFFCRKKNHRSLSNNFEVSMDNMKKENTNASESLLNLYEKVFLDLKNKIFFTDFSSKKWMKLLTSD